MKRNNKKDLTLVMKSIFMAHFILVMHLFLIAGFGFLVLFFRGIVIYMPWIFIGGSCLIAAASYLFIKRMKKEGKNLKEMLSLPVFKGRSVEVSFLGGIASLKLDKPNDIKMIESSSMKNSKTTKENEEFMVSELMELVKLLDNNMITLDEYNQAKKRIFNS